MADLWRKFSLRFGLVLIMLQLCANCNNYGLLDKLENPGSTTSTTTAQKKLYAFVTGAASKGDMADFVVAGCAGTGLTKADCVCQNLAAANGLLQGTNPKFVAWLSDATNDMTCRIFGGGGVNCTQTGGYSWYNTMEELLFAGVGELQSGVVRNPLKYTETKSLAIVGNNVWTGTNSNGSTAGSAATTCANWSANISQTGMAGSLGNLTATWTNNLTPSCSSTAQIYCFAVP